MNLPSAMPLELCITGVCNLHSFTENSRFVSSTYCIDIRGRCRAAPKQNPLSKSSKKKKARGDILFSRMGLLQSLQLVSRSGHHSFSSSSSRHGQPLRRDAADYWVAIELAPSACRGLCTLLTGHLNSATPRTFSHLPRAIVYCC